MLLDGKRLVITGVLTDDSIAWHTEVPINGEIQEVHDPLGGQAEHQVLTVLWSDGNRGNILACNVEFCPRARQLSAQRRQERGA